MERIKSANQGATASLLPDGRRSLPCISQNELGRAAVEPTRVVPCVHSLGSGWWSTTELAGTKAEVEGRAQGSLMLATDLLKVTHLLIHWPKVVSWPHTVSGEVGRVISCAGKYRYLVISTDYSCILHDRLEFIWQFWFSLGGFSVCSAAMKHNPRYVFSRWFLVPCEPVQECGSPSSDLHSCGMLGELLANVT